MALIGSDTARRPGTRSASVKDGDYTQFTACDACRKRKKVSRKAQKRCDGRIAGCAHCVANKLECIYRAKKAKPPQKDSSEVERDKVVKIVDRIHRIEQAILTSPSVVRNPHYHATFEEFYQAIDNHQAVEDVDSASDSAEEEEEEQHEDIPEFVLSPSRSYDIIDVEELAQKMRTLAIETADVLWESPDKAERSKQNATLEQGSHEESRVFMGAASPFAFISYAGMKWVHEELGNTGFTEVVNRSRNAFTNRMFFPEGLDDSEGLGSAFGNGLNAPHYDPRFNDIYTREYFTNINCWMPVFDEAEFSVAIENTLQNGHTHPAWAIAINAVHALGAQSLACNKKVPNAENSDAWAYARCACRYVPSLLLRPQHPETIAVQALLGLILFFIETDGMVPCHTLLGLAASLGTYIGFHRDMRAGLSPHTIKMRRNAFWVYYILDKEVMLRSGRPTCITELDIDVPLPSIRPHNDVEEGGPTLWQKSYFRDRAQFAQIASGVLRLLYSSENAEMPPVTTSHLTEHLSEKLEVHKQRCPWTRFSMDELISKAIAANVSLTWTWWANLIRIRWSYLNCLISLYRLPFDLLSPPPARSGILRPGPSGISRVSNSARIESCAFFRLLSSGLMPYPPRTTLLQFLACQFILFITVLRKNSLNGNLEEYDNDGSTGMSDEEIMKNLAVNTGNGRVWGTETLRFRKLVFELARGMWFLLEERSGMASWVEGQVPCFTTV